MTTLDPNILYALIGICVLLFFGWTCRELYVAMTTTHEQRVRVEAQRRILHFCKNPTKANYQSAWQFIHDEDVRLGDLDWPLVQRFSRMAVQTNFSPEVQG